MIEVEEETAQLSPTLYQELQSGGGRSKSNPICPPPEVKRDGLDLIFNYYRYHCAPGHSHKEHKSFDDNLFKKDRETLAMMIYAAEYLKLDELHVKLRDTFIWRSFSSKERVEFSKVFAQAEESGDPRHVNKLCAKTKKVLEKLKKPEADKGAQKNEDPRSVNDLLSFIVGDSKGDQTATRKKKKRTKKNKQKNTPSVSGSVSTEPSSSSIAIESHAKDPSARDVETHRIEGSSGVSDGSRLLETEVGGLTLEDEPDDDFDHAWNEKVDREVQDFAQRLNLVLEESSLLYVIYNKKE